MFTAELTKHLSEIRGYLRNFKFEFSSKGIYFPAMKAVAQGQFIEWPGNPFSHLDRQAAGIWPNLVVDQGLNHAISITLLGGTQIPAASWYLAIGSGIGPVLAAWTGANYTANGVEWTGEAPEGYDETTRQAWTGAANTGDTSANNTASPAVLTIATASSLAVNNAALIGSDNVKGGVTGTLMGSVIYGATRTLGDNDTYNVQYKFDLNTP